MLREHGRARSAVSGQPANADELEAQRVDAVEKAVQRGLIAHRPVEHRLDGSRVALEVLEAVQDLLADRALQADLVAVSVRHVAGKRGPPAGEPASSTQGDFGSAHPPLGHGRAPLSP
jgi:hypothetical protein